MFRAGSRPPKRRPSAPPAAWHCPGPPPADLAGIRCIAEGDGAHLVHGNVDRGRRGGLRPLPGRHPHSLYPGRTGWGAGPAALAVDHGQIIALLPDWRLFCRCPGADSADHPDLYPVVAAAATTRSGSGSSSWWSPRWASSPRRSGVNVYVVSGIERDVPLQTSSRARYHSCWPFLLVAFPKLSLWLPELMQ
jgi:hypothetical protein